MTQALPARADFDAAEPFAQGVMAYTYSAWPGSKIPSERKNPYPKGSKEHDQFKDGVHSAVLCAQDSEE